ncbi:hypothetical protein PR003_g6830 [Phytophthora rubi]|uniref:Uncharacterized protein n=1 Tax=Phytophthora rubi TaxID=129364 RepID=A0A6A3MZ38_9STRA|nr:hypothetical protein PR002_g6785 [Phytophthora rubi]KAE9347625.1 hypothetical protein PR003_g6830 [Phytophthora rubi]
MFGREDTRQEVLGHVQTCYCRDSFQSLATLNCALMLVFNYVGFSDVIDSVM